MNRRMLIGSMAILIAGVCMGQTTKPAPTLTKIFETYPSHARTETTMQSDAVVQKQNAWFESHKGEVFTEAAKVSDVYEEKTDGTICVFSEVVLKANGESMRMSVTVSYKSTPENKTKLSALKHGDPITLKAKITTISYSETFATAE